MLVATLWVAGCPSEEAEPPPVGNVVVFTPAPPADPTPGAFAGMPFVQLEIDPTQRDAITALGACAHWITQCVNPESRSVDDCFRSVPNCTADEPWREAELCCPAQCYAEYADRRRAGEDALAAFDAVLFVDRTCMPGLEQLLKEGRR